MSSITPSSTSQSITRSNPLPFDSAKTRPHQKAPMVDRPANPIYDGSNGSSSSDIQGVSTFSLDGASASSVSTGANQSDTRIAQARTAAEGLVSATFIEPILKQVRESNTAPPPFGPSSAEKQFSALLDTNLADEIVHAANFPLVQRMADQMLRNMPAPIIQTTHQPLDIEG